MRLASVVATLAAFGGLADLPFVTAAPAAGPPFDDHASSRLLERDDDKAPKLSYVNNSGICETTPGVKQYSGYLSVGKNMNMCTCGRRRSRPPPAQIGTAQLTCGASSLLVFRESQ